MKKVCWFVVALLVVSPAWAVYHGWNGKGHAGRLDDVANWGISTDKFTSDDFHDPGKTKSGSENQCGCLGSGTYTIGADTYFNRMVIDKANQSAVNLDLGANTLYLIGIDGHALGATAAGNGTSYYVTSGTLCVPLQHNGSDTLDNAYAGLPRSATDSALHDASLFAKGATAVLDLKKAMLDWGTNNVIGAVDGGTLKACTLEMSVAKQSRGNRYYFANGGKLKNPYANPTKDQLCLNFAFGGTADEHRYEFAEGGTVEGYERFSIDGGTGFEVRFTGADTDVTFNTTNGNSTLLMTGTRNLLSVQDGAKLRVTNSLNSAGRARIWVNGSGNVIRASGAGSLMQFHNNGNLIGQYGTSGHLVHVTDHAEIRMAGIHLGQGGSKSKQTPAANNRLLVDNHGVFRDWDTLVVGYGADFTCCSNRMDVSDGGTVYANRIYVGQDTNGVDNVADVGAGGTVNVAVDMMVGYYGHRNALDVHDGGCLNVTKDFFVGYRGGATNRVVFRDGARASVGGLFATGTSAQFGCTSDNVIEIRSGAEVTAGNVAFYCSNSCVTVENALLCATNGGTNVIGFQIPWYNERDWNCHLILSGTNPVVRTLSRNATAYGNHAFGVRRGGKVTFVVPKGGYVEPPLQAPNGRLGIFDNAKGDVPEICFDLSELDEGRTETVLTRSKELYITPLAMNRLQANLRAAVDARFGATTPCRVKTTNSELRITVGMKGAAVIVR